MRFGIAKRHQQAVAHATSQTTASGGDLRAAYERGRREERARHHHSPLLSLGLGATALVGGAVLALSALHGSFAGGGASLDHGLSAAAHQAGPTLREAGHALKSAGEELKSKSATAAGKGA